jgi:hypothetical protein
MAALHHPRWNASGDDEKNIYFLHNVIIFRSVQYDGDSSSYRKTANTVYKAAYNYTRGGRFNEVIGYDELVNVRACVRGPRTLVTLE